MFLFYYIFVCSPDRNGKPFIKKNAIFVVVKKRPTEVLFTTYKMHFFYKCL